MYEKLQNGSDIRGVAIPTDKSEVTLTQSAVARIGAAFIEFLHKNKGMTGEHLRIAVGNDSRLSAKSMLDALAAGMCKMGAYVCYTGLSSTPAMFMSTIMDGHEFDAAVMITASHLPYEKNGFKFFTRQGGAEKSDIKEILRIAEELDVTGAKAEYTEHDIMTDYAKSLRDVIIKKAGLGDMPLSGLHIVIDAGNGAGGFFEAEILQKLGARTDGSVFCIPDGHFPNHAPNPEDKAAMAAISSAVTGSGADFGIIFDTDADRTAVVLADGAEINRNRLIALMCAILTKTHKSPTIVTDSVTSTGLNEFITKHGGIHRRFMRGYRNVINEAVRLCGEGHDACLAIETSGHGAMRENYFLDDGAYTACVILAELAKCHAEGKKISSLIEELAEPYESIELRIKIKADNFAEYGKKVLTELEASVQTAQGESVAPDNFEGIRVNTDKEHGDGWYLLRMSLHDPVLPLNIESNSAGGAEIMRARLMKFIEKYELLEV